jgi:uridine kinase
MFSLFVFAIFSIGITENIMEKEKKSKKVFISYAKEDAEIAERLYVDLKRCGVQTWLDSENLLPGQNYKLTIEKAIEECSYFIALLSSNSVSKQGFIQKELKKSLDMLDLIPSNKIFIIPVRLDSCSPDYEKLKYIHYADLFPQYEKGFAKLLQVLALDDNLIEDSDKPRLVIGISGPSCSGKTWLAKKLKEIRPHSSCLFDLDSYYKDIEYVSALEHRHDNPSSINFDDALVDLTLLKSGKDVEIPIYNFETHEKCGYTTCKPAQLIIFEGLFIFANERLRKEIDLKLWIDSGEGVRYHRRIKRDTNQRGRSIEEVIRRYDDDVQPGYLKFVHPLRQHADIIIQNNGMDDGWNPLVLDIIISYFDTIKRSEKRD